VAWRQQVPVEGGPDPLAFDPRHRFLYVACRDRRQLSSYRIDPLTGGLSLIGTVPIEGEPIQIVIDRTGRFLLSVYFYQSTIGVHAINEQGQIAPTPVEWRVTSYGCHGIEVDPSNRYVFVPHVTRSGGPNAVAQFRFDEKTGHLAWNAPAFLTLTEHEGPRHLLVHPTLNMAYSADEQGASATAYRLEPATGLLAKVQSISTVPANYTVKSEITCSEVLIHPNGKLLFVVTREHDSIASFTIDQTDGPIDGRGSRGHRTGREAALPRSGRALHGRGRQRRHRGPHGHLPNRRGHGQDDAARRLRRRQRARCGS
jgi:6-phosphogluconolactonase